VSVVSAFPTGTVTLLFTDIEGSTKLLERIGDAYAGTLAEHDRIVRDAIATHRGVEVGTAGDSFFVAFASATDALAAAREAQAAFADASGVRVRMGLHTGEPMPVDDGYVGMDVHRAARISAAAHGGQILLSEATRSFVDADDIRDLGIQRLKDVGEFRLYQVGDEVFPPLRTLGMGNLPAIATPLVGREAERAAIADLLGRRGERLVTLVGPGGIGKTRLAIEVARGLTAAFPDGVWFVDLAPINDPDRFEAAVAAVVGAAGDLASHLGERRTLLVLDNFEQIIDVSDRVARLLENCPNAASLTTTREALHLRGERVFPLEPLTEDASIELFQERARSVAPDLDAPQALLARICERLDRMPLAIELAAARVRVLDPEHLYELLNERLPILTGGPRDAPARQRALRSTIEWSYGLLDVAEQRLFARLGVFLGGATFDAAAGVCDADLDTLQQLVDKSLLSAKGGRFTMLETIREFAVERLEASGEAERIRARHAGSFADLVARAEPFLTGPEQDHWLDRIATDYENIQAAFRWLADARDRVPDALRLAGELLFFWYIRGRYDGLAWLERALALSDGDRSIARARALWAAGFLLAIVAQGERVAPLIEECLEIARADADPSLIARSFDVLGMLAFFQNDVVRARTMYEEAIRHARTADDRWCLADCLGTLSSIYPLVGEFVAARQAGTEALDIARREDDRQGIRMALFGLALTEYRSGRSERARPFAEEGLAICRGIGDRFFAAYFLWIVGLIEAGAGAAEHARRAADESLEIAEELQVPLLLVCALEAEAASARSGGDDAAARVLLTRADAIGRAGMVPASYTATIARTLGVIERAHGDPAAGREHLVRALQIATEVGDSWGIRRAEEALAGGDEEGSVS
jgi:predicted ATPase/class 3 adenylate cyclase